MDIKIEPTLFVSVEDTLPADGSDEDLLLK